MSRIPDSPSSSLSIWKNLRYDIPAGVVVFLVALPLCLGIALASQGTVDSTPLFSGILAGIIGGLVVPLISRSPLSVSGPAAGLIAIVITGIDQAGSFDAFMIAVMLGGVLQLGLGFLKAGTIAYFFPSSVIKGMLAAIGLILIRKQIPHAIGVDKEATDLRFHFEDTRPFIEEVVLEQHYEVGAIVISLIGLAILITWEKTRLGKMNFLPGALVVVIVGVLLNQLFQYLIPGWYLFGGEEGHLVHLPESIVSGGLGGLVAQMHLPDWSALGNPKIYVIALTIGLVASVETLLSVEAVDKLDPHKRSSPLNRELLAQGTANVLGGLLGALPITAVIVRSSANINSGGRTRMSALVHGLLLLFAVAFVGGVLNLIPLSSLAVILLMVGYKLAQPALFRSMYANGWNQFVPFVTTVLAVLITDLLTGIAIGTAVGIFFTVRANFRTAIKVEREEEAYVVRLNKDVSFLNKAILNQTLNRIPHGKKVIIDGSRADFIDMDIQEIIREFQVRAAENDMEFEVRGVKASDAQG